MKYIAVCFKIQVVHYTVTKRLLQVENFTIRQSKNQTELFLIYNSFYLNCLNPASFHFSIKFKPSMCAVFKITQRRTIKTSMLPIILK